MSTIHAIIPGAPAAKERPRAGKGGRFYTPRATQDAEQSIAEYVIIQNRNAGFDPKARFKVDIHFYGSKRGDLDNKIKTVWDGITKSGVVWRDDSQVDVLYAIRSAPDTKGERTEIWVRPL